jgi:hypothetical protein
LKEIWAKYKGDKSKKWEAEYAIRSRALDTSFINTSVVCGGLATVFALLKVIDWAIAVYHHWVR